MASHAAGLLATASAALAALVRAGSSSSSAAAWRSLARSGGSSAASSPMDDVLMRMGTRDPKSRRGKVRTAVGGANWARRRRRRPRSVSPLPPSPLPRPPYRSSRSRLARLVALLLHCLGCGHPKQAAASSPLHAAPSLRSRGRARRPAPTLTCRSRSSLGASRTLPGGRGRRRFCLAAERRWRCRERMLLAFVRATLVATPPC